MQWILIMLRGHYRSNGAKNGIPHDSSKIVKEFDGRGPWIHARGDDKLNRIVIFMIELEDMFF